MPGNVLITGTSGYLGGSLCSQLCQLGVPDLKIFALVRSASQYDLVRQMGAEPLTFDAYEQSSVSKVINENSINIVYYLIDCDKSNGAFCFIRALADLKKESGMETHLIFVSQPSRAATTVSLILVETTGTKQFGKHAGAPTDQPLLDTNPNLYDIQKSQESPHSWARGVGLRAFVRTVHQLAKISLSQPIAR